MLSVILITFFLSLSPFGEARAGIPYAVINDLHFIPAFGIGLLGNLLVYPLMTWLVDAFNHKLWPWRPYKKCVLYIARFAKRKAKSNIDKYGFWGLMVFVMVPLPGTGAYMGTIAAALFNIERRQAFLAITIGTIISCIIMAVGMYLASLGTTLF